MASTTNRISSGSVASAMAAAWAISSSSMPSRPAVSITTTLCRWYLASSMDCRATATGSPTPLPGSGAYTGTPACSPSTCNCCTAFGRCRSAATISGVLPCAFSQRASFAASVVLPEPCRPASMITVGGFLANRSLRASPPRIATSSSLTILMTCWTGVSAAETSSEEVSAALNPVQQVIKIVNEELVAILGGEARRLRFAKNPPTVIMLAGLQGSGKTTLAAKLALSLKEQGNTPMLVAADLQRPNAVTQLQVIGQRAGVPVYAPEPGNGVGDPVAVARQSLDEARRSLHNIVIIDTAGRLGVDAEMMAQAVAIRDATQPDEVLFVVDAMIGQDAVATAQAFLDGVGYDAVVLTKLDGDARGGAALSIVQLTGRPIMFASSGEKLEDFDLFHPDRMASRILDLGDVLTLIEQAEKAFDREQTESLAGRIASGEGFTLEDFVEQLSMVRKLGPIGNLLGMLPGAAKNRELLSQVNDKDLDRAEAIVRSMTPEERRNPKVINGSRRARIAGGSGVAVGEVSQLVTNFYEGQKQMKAMFSGAMPGMPPGMGAMARRAAAKQSRGKKGGSKKKPARSGDPRRAAELARGASSQAPANSGTGPAGAGGAPAGLGGA